MGQSVLCTVVANILIENYFRCFPLSNWLRSTPSIPLLCILNYCIRTRFSRFCSYRNSLRKFSLDVRYDPEKLEMGTLVEVPVISKLREQKQPRPRAAIPPSAEPRFKASFLFATFTRTAPTCLARRSSSSRKSGRSRPKTTKSRAARLDPILDDKNIDTTDITTYVSCPTCFNSIMLRPEQLERGPMQVSCNCCGKRVKTSMAGLENMDGTMFDEQAWRAGLATRNADGKSDEKEMEEQAGLNVMPESDRIP